MDNAYSLVRIEVGGIQKFILGTGKLKEMIGGSEIIEDLSKGFFQSLVAELGLREAEAPEPGTGWYVPAQANAGTLCLVMPAENDEAKSFLSVFSQRTLERFPGLPLFGAVAPMAWDAESYRQARREAEEAIGQMRARIPVPEGCPMLPPLKAAHLDGLPAVGEEKGIPFSLPSRTRRDKEYLEKSRRRLQELVGSIEGVKLKWADDLEEMLGAESGRVALVHMDGNDFGKLFMKKLEESGNAGSLAEGMSNIRAFSGEIAKLSSQAFSRATREVVDFELKRSWKAAAGGVSITAPLRPLVLGGDDVTLIIRADLALLFVQAFCAAFEEASAQAGDRLSLGVGMVAMPSSYPFAKAFSLVEDLTDSAKRLTAGMENRPSSIDYLVLTEDVEDDLDEFRRRTCTARDGALLTGKPFELADMPFIAREGLEVIRTLPRRAVRSAAVDCHQGADAAQPAWNDLHDNLVRGVGGRRGDSGSLMSAARFEELFPEGFFAGGGGEEGARLCTRLGDYLEFARLLPEDKGGQDDMLERMAAQQGGK